MEREPGSHLLLELLPRSRADQGTQPIAQAGQHGADGRASADVKDEALQLVVRERRNGPQRGLATGAAGE